MHTFAINLAEDQPHARNGKLARSLLLKVDGRQQAVVNINLESAPTIARTARNWSEQFGIDQAKVVSELQELGIEVLDEVVKRRQQRDEAPNAQLRISALADEFLGTLKPEWHKKHRTIYFQGLGREVALGSLWALANDVLVDRVLGTAEAHEAARDGPPPPYRARLALLKEAIAMAGSRLVTTLPAVDDATQDNTLDQEDLLDSLVAWLLAPRNFRTDHGTPIGTTYHGWALALTPGAGWLQCLTAPVFGRISEASSRPEICVKAEVLKVDLKYEKKRRMIGDLERSGYAKKTSIKVAGCAIHILKLDAKVLDAIGGCAL